MIETIDSIKLANELNKRWSSILPSDPLKILVQVNTSQEEGLDLEIVETEKFLMVDIYQLKIFFVAKSGIEPDNLIELYRHIIENCKHLSVNGLMTIGKFGYDYSLGPNPDFLCLLDCHKNVCNTFHLSPENVAISMGMSDDFERAVS